MAYMFKGKQSVGFRAQADLSTPAATGSSTDWIWPVCDAPDITFGDAAEISEMRLTNGAGVSPQPDVGSRDGGTFTVRGPLLGQLSTYDHTSDTPVVSPMAEILAWAIGSTVTSAYDAGDVAAGSTTSTLNTTAGTYKIGTLVPYAASASAALNGMGWSTTQATQAISLADPAEQAGDSGDDTWPAVNAFIDYTSPTPKTGRIVGRNAEEDLRLIGCMPTAWKIEPVSGVIYAEVDIVFTDHAWEGSGGLVSPLAYVKLPNIKTKANSADHTGARMLLDGATACPLNDWSVSGTIDYAVLGPFGRQGVCSRIVTDREVMVEFTKPVDDGDISSNELSWDDDYESNADLELSFFLGHTAGSVFSWYTPALQIVSRPQPVIIGKRLIGRRVSCKLARYIDDAIGDGAAGAINAGLRFALA